MKDAFSPAARAYIMETLGARSYLCPESIYSLRALKGGLPCRTLAVVFKPPSLSQKLLLKKIMAGIDILEFSLLEIKSPAVLNDLLLSQKRWADFICFFGGSHFFETELLTPPPSAPASPHQKPGSVLRLCSLEELDGQSPEIIDRKKQAWNQLKSWKAKMPA